MKTYISILRGINVGGHKKILMEDLKKLYESLGFKNVQTYIQSGNVIFGCSDTNILVLVSKIEQEIKKIFAFDVSVLIRTKNEFQKLIDHNPFPKKDPSKLYVTFLSNTPSQSHIKEINILKDKSEEFVMDDKAIYLFLPNGYGRTKLTNNFFEKILNTSATTRNWNTINELLKIIKKYSED